MANERVKLIDANAADLNEKIDRNFGPVTRAAVKKLLRDTPEIKAADVVYCKGCTYAKPYERIDGKTGYYCRHPKCTFRYGANMDRLFTPVKEADDFCSLGEKKEDKDDGK